MQDLYPLGQMPPLGEVPPRMLAHLIRPERFGEPTKAFQVEQVEVPADLRPDEVLVWVMAAGVNYNNVWASLGVPVHVVIHCGTWSRDDPIVRADGDPMFGASFRIWGYETNWGSFAQFTRVQAHQCLPKPKHLTWEAAAAYMLVGATAYRMLMAWPPHTVQPGDAVLVWGGAGGLGSQAIQIVRVMGGTPVAVVSSEDKFEFCRRLGAKGCINRKKFSHWGMLPHWKD